MLKTLLNLVLIALLIGFAVAQDDDGFVEEDAHEHGAATLNVAQEADVLSVEFISPSVNIVGFEYQPGTPEEEEVVETALTDLADGAALFAPSDAAGCVLLSADVEGMEDHSDEHGDEEHSDEEEHSEDEEHSDEEGEEHSEDEEHAEGEEHSDEEHSDEEAETHSEFHATYEFSCENAAELAELELAELFSLYPGIEDLDVQYALESAQGAAELNASSTQLTF